MCGDGHEATGIPDRERFPQAPWEALQGAVRAGVEAVSTGGTGQARPCRLDGTKIKANASKHKAMSYERMVETEPKHAAGSGRQAKSAGQDAQDRRTGRAARRRGARLGAEQGAPDHQDPGSQSGARSRGAAAAADKPTGRGKDPPGTPPGKACPGVRPGAAQLHRSAEPDHEDHGRLCPGLQRAGRGRRHGAGHRGPDGQQPGERLSASGGLVKQIKTNSRRRPSRSRPMPAIARRTISRPSNPTSRRHIATGRHKHGAAAPEADPPAANPGSGDGTKLRAAGHQGPYRLRKQVVEPVFGQIKQARGFRQFLRRGLAQVQSEWTLICTVHNLLKLAAARSLIQPKTGIAA